MKRRTLLAFAVIGVGLAAYLLLRKPSPGPESDATAAPPAEFTEVWYFDPPAPGVAPVVLSGTSLSVTHPGGAHATLYVVDDRTSKLIWSSDAGGALSPGIAWHGVDPVFLPAGDKLVAVSPDTGVPDWELPLADKVSAQPLYVGVLGHAAVSAGDAGVYFFQTRTGRPVWHAKDVGRVVTSPVGGGRVVVATAAPELVALNEDTGAVEWRVPLPGRPTGGRPWHGNTVCVVPLANGTACFDAATGRAKWFLPEDAAVTLAANLLLLSSPAWDGVKAFALVGTADGFVRQVDVETGVPRWSARVGGPVVGSPTHGWLYVFAATTDGRIVMLDHITGAPAGQFRIPGGGPVLAASVGPRSHVVVEADTPAGRRPRLVCYEYAHTLRDATR